MHRVSMGLVVAAVALLVAPVPTPSAGRRTVSAPASSAAAGVDGPYPPRVTMITDSVGGVLFWVAASREKLALGLDFRLEVKTCRKLVSPGCYAYGEVPPSVLDTVAALGPELGRLVVVDVGYNDLSEGYADGLDAVMAALTAAGVEHVVWVTLGEAQGNWIEINDQIRAARARWPQLVVADWAPIARGQPSWFVDGAHMNELGADGFVTFLRPEIFAACGAACVPPPPTATITGSVVRSGRVTLRWRGDPFAKTYDVAVRRSGGAWRTLATRLAGTTYRVRGVAGARMQARVRARDEADVQGAWSPPRAFRF